MLPDAAIQALQVATIALAAPLLSGFIAKVEARIQGRSGVRVLQPYYDLFKLFAKETLAPEGAGVLFFVAPVIALACYCIVPMLIPVLTTFPLPLGYIGDILAGGLILGLASFLTSLAATESGDPYAQLGASRGTTFHALIEPAFLFVLFTVGILTGTDLPYAMASAVRSSGSAILEPAHVLAAIAFFLVVLADTGRIPVETHTGTLEFGMIDEARLFEHSGPTLALFKWGSMMKQMILYTIFLDVFVAPWGLASGHGSGAVLLAILALLGKASLVGILFALIDNAFAKLRLFKITEFMGAVFLLAVLSLFAVYFVGNL